MPASLQRKYAEHSENCTLAQQLALALAHVEPRCVEAWAKSDLEQSYAKGSVCYVELGPDDFSSANFDGKSHQACSRWAVERFNLDSGSWRRMLGWAIQRDGTGHYLRFASTLNQKWGQNPSSSPTLTERRVDSGKPVGQRKEVRDLPKSWAQFFERILSRDLVLALVNQDRYERMAARGDEGATTKLHRFS